MNIFLPSTSIKSWFVRHGFALFFAFLVGMLSVAPHLLAVRALGSDYRGIPFMYLDDEDLYLVRMQEIRDGHPKVGSPMLFENKDFNSPVAPIAENVYVLFSSILRVGLPQILILTKFLFPAVLCLLIYFFIRRLTDDAWSSIAGALLITLAYDLTLPQTLLSWFRGEDIGLGLSLWTRPVNPITGGILLFCWLNLVWDFVKCRRSLRIILAGLVNAAMVGYFFSWGLVATVTFFLFVFYAIQRKWRVVRDLVFVVLIAILASSSYWIAAIRAVSGNEGRVFSLRNGMLLTHSPLLNKTLFLALFLCCAVIAFECIRKKNLREIVVQDWLVFCAALLFGGLLALNQQVLTGRTIWPYHFVQYTKPFAVIVIMVVFSRLIRPNFSKIWKSFICVAVLFSIASGIIPATQTRASDSDFRSRQKDAVLFDWLKANAPSDCVVLVREPVERLGRLIPAFTSCNVYSSSYIFFGVPTERLLHNLFVHLRMSGVLPEKAEEYLREHHDLVRAYFYEDWKQLLNGSPDAWSDAQAANLARGYADFVTKSFGDELRRYRVDYISNTEPMEPSLISQLQLEYTGEFGGTWLYRVIAKP